MPYMGTRKLSKKLSPDEVLNDNGIDCVGRKPIRQYTMEMGIYEVYPKQNTSKRNKEHNVPFYILKLLLYRLTDLFACTPFLLDQHQIIFSGIAMDITIPI